MPGTRPFPALPMRPKGLPNPRRATKVQQNHALRDVRPALEKRSGGKRPGRRWRCPADPCHRAGECRHCLHRGGRDAVRGGRGRNAEGARGRVRRDRRADGMREIHPPQCRGRAAQALRRSLPRRRRAGRRHQPAGRLPVPVRRADALEDRIENVAIGLEYAASPAPSARGGGGLAPASGSPVSSAGFRTSSPAGRGSASRSPRC